jgi:hypothetical protein
MGNLLYQSIVNDVQVFDHLSGNILAYFRGIMAAIVRFKKLINFGFEGLRYSGKGLRGDPFPAGLYVAIEACKGLEPLVKI